MKIKEETPVKPKVETPAAPAEEEVSEEKVDEVVGKILSKLESKMEEKVIKEAKVKADKVKADMSQKENVNFGGNVNVFSKAAGIYVPKGPEEISIKSKDGREIKLVGEKLHREAEYIRAIITGNLAYLAEYQAKALAEGTAALGGSLVSQEWSNILVIARDNVGIARNVGFRVVNLNKDTFNIPSRDGRAKASWGTENQTKTTTSASFAEISLTPYKMFCLLYSSEELVADSDFDILTEIKDQFSTAMAELEDDGFSVGSGTAEPTGFTTYTVGGFSGSLSYGNLISLIFRLGVKYRKNAKFFAHRYVVSKIYGLTDTNGQPVIHPDPTSPATHRIMGYEVVEWDDIAQTQLWFGDPSTYWIGDRQGIKFETNRYSETAWTKDQISFRAVERVDGELTDTRGFVCLTIA